MCVCVFFFVCLKGAAMKLGCVCVFRMLCYIGVHIHKHIILCTCIDQDID